MAAARTTDPETDQTTNAINGVMELPDGFASFADADLIATAGGLPFEEQLAASGLSPSDAMTFTYRVSLPGELVSAEEGTEVDGAIEWQRRSMAPRPICTSRRCGVRKGTATWWDPQHHAGTDPAGRLGRDGGRIHRVRRVAAAEAARQARLRRPRPLTVATDATPTPPPDRTSPP
ncbi:MAG: hypothetical protein R2705_21815 [Ilumatobacteraceae bacterium]